MKKTSKTKKVQTVKKCDDCRTPMGKWLSGVAVTLGMIIVLTVVTLGILELRGVRPISGIDQKKLEVFDSITQGFIQEQEIVEGGSFQHLTGYGISDEDGAFYLTFEFVRLNSEVMFSGESFETAPVEYGVMYFWPSEYGGYGHAYSYHDEAYHPDGEYVKLGE